MGSRAGYRGLLLIKGGLWVLSFLGLGTCSLSKVMIGSVALVNNGKDFWTYVLKFLPSGSAFSKQHNLLLPHVNNSLTCGTEDLKIYMVEWWFEVDEFVLCCCHCHGFRDPHIHHPNRPSNMA